MDEVCWENSWEVGVGVLEGVVFVGNALCGRERRLCEGCVCLWELYVRRRCSMYTCVSGLWRGVGVGCMSVCQRAMRFVNVT